MRLGTPHDDHGSRAHRPAQGARRQVVGQAPPQTNLVAAVEPDGERCNRRPSRGGKTSPDENTRGRSSNELARDDVSDAMAKLKVSLSNNKAAAGKTRAGKSSSPTGSAPGSSEKKKDAETKQRPRRW